MKKRLLVVTTLMFASTGVFGQQDMALTHFIYNKMAFNPAAAGIDDGICGSLIYRNQWDKVNGAPNSAIFNGEANLDRILPMGVGLSVVHDAIGFNRQDNVLANFAYHFSLPNDLGTLAAGVGVGMVNFRLSPVWVPPSTIFDPTLPVSSSATALDANAGLYWKRRNYYIGLSATHINAPSLAYATASGAANYNSVQHFFAMAGYDFDNTNLMSFLPNNHVLSVQGMLRTDLVKYSFDINARYIVNSLFYGGLTYRTGDALAVMAGITFYRNTFTNQSSMYILASYSYDLTINKLSSISRGTNELALKGCYLLPPPPVQKSKHPRYL